MNTSGADGTPIGGGEVLKWWGNADLYESQYPYMDVGIMKQFDMLTAVKFGIIILIILIMGMVLLRMLNIKSVFRGKGITRELDYMDKVKKYDESVIRANKILAWITDLISRTPFILSKSSLEYWQYNLTRAGIYIPGKSRIIKAEEFNAVVIFIAGCSCIVSAILFVTVNTFLGGVMLITTIIMASTLPMMLLRGTIKVKDLEIKENFADYYLMLHYVLVANAKTPLSGIMKSYAKTTSSKEMQKYIDTCIHYIDTHGEYEAARRIAKAYREIPEVVKLMRLIRQANEGGDIEPELMGFRNELLKEREYVITKRMERLVARARASFNLLMPILIQAVISAMSIYFNDLGIAGSLLGGAF